VGSSKEEINKEKTSTEKKLKCTLFRVRCDALDGLHRVDGR